MDHTIRPITVAEQAEQAARRFVDTCEPQPNPHTGTALEQRWRSLYDRWILQLSAEQDTEASA